MSRIFIAEILKIVFYKSFWIFTASFAIIFLLISGLSSEFASNFVGGVKQYDPGKYFSVPLVWNTYSWIAGWFHSLLGVIIILLVCNQFEFRTLRQHVIDGFSRTQVMFGQLFLVLSLSLYSCVLVVVTSLMYAGVPEGLSFFENAGALFGLFLHGCAYLSFALLAAVIAKRPAASILIFLLYPLMIEPLVGYIIDNQFGTQIASYLPFEVIGHIVKSPFAAFGMSAETMTASAVMQISGLYSMAFFLIAWVRIKLIDL